MGWFFRLFRLFRRRSDRLERYQERLQELLWKMDAAHLQIAEARNVEELGLARSSLQASMFELQRLIRLAKSEAGVELRPLEQVEQAYINMLNHLRTTNMAGNPVSREQTARAGIRLVLVNTGFANNTLVHIAPD